MMYEMTHAGYMRAMATIAVIVLLLAPAASASEGGVNEEMDLSGTPISEIQSPSVTSDGEEFEVAIFLDDEASGNGTTVTWVWQVCLNSGVCLQPTPETADYLPDGSWRASMVPVDDHSYVNYRVILNWQDGNETTYPESGFGAKIWSDCWVSGNDSGGSGCGGEGNLPGFTLIFSAAALSVGALMVRRK